MGKYKVNYKLLKEQSSELQGVIKALGAYGEELTALSGQISDADQALVTIKNSLRAGAQSLQELSGSLKLAAEVLGSGMEKYAKAESSNVKKVDAAKAHNRDFYKNPVAVPSAGGGGVGGASAAPRVARATAPTGNASAATTNNTLHFSDNSTTNVSYTGTATAPEAAGTAAAAAPATGLSGGAVAGAALGAAALTGAGILGAQKLKKTKEKKDAAHATPSADEELTRLEFQLDDAIAEANRLKNDANV